MRCDLIADASCWAEAEPFVAEALAWADRAGLEALPLYARRLSGRAALANGIAQRAIDDLTTAAGGFAERGAEWERARTELFLAEALTTAGQDASEVLRTASAAFERLGALREAALARELADRAGA